MSAYEISNKPRYTFLITNDVFGRRIVSNIISDYYNSLFSSLKPLI